MDTVDLAHAKDHLVELLERAVRGEDVRISDAAIGTVKLTVIGAASSPPQRRPGRWKGRLNIPDDALLEPMSEDELALWYGDKG
jgi:antitoxin (DNA-binding transcriptional repressor) of toxin-antitoxin stability system